jgi:hypothetical protein
MKTESFAWKVYKLLFLDIWHHQFFHSRLKPQQTDFTEEQLADYLSELNLTVTGYRGNDKINFTKDQPVTLFYASHPSTFDAFYVYALLKKVDPFFVSFIHNQLHFKFLEKRIIPVAAYFKAQEPTLLGAKMKFAKVIEDLDEDQARRINRQVTQKAVQRLANGDSVVIFPSGGWGKWQDGIGFIISQFYEQYPKRELVLQPLKEKSFREIHSVLHGFLHSLGIKVPAQVRIEIGEKHLVSQLMNVETIKQIKDPKKKSKKIRAYLEKAYQKI